jgi:predicted transcriptional regulator
MQITIQIPDDLQQKLTERATQLDIPLETLILESLTDLVELADPDDTPKEIVLESLRVSLEDAKAGRVYPVEELWDGIDE